MLYIQSVVMLQRILAIVLFAATVLPFAAPVLLAGSMAEASLPMCCRRNGIHHCADPMAMAELTRNQTMARSPQMKCPFQQRALGTVHVTSFALVAASTETSGVLRAPSAAAQAECLWRIAFDRARQKRGPPSTRLS
jgi:hypothetical protein